MLLPEGSMDIDDLSGSPTDPVASTDNSFVSLASPQSAPSVWFCSLAAWVETNAEILQQSNNDRLWSLRQPSRGIKPWNSVLGIVRQ